MTALGVLALLIYAFGAYAYGSVLLLSLQDFGRRRWAAQRGASGQAAMVGSAMMLLGVVWFVANLVYVVMRMGPPTGDWTVDLLILWLAFLWPPVIMHVTLAEVEAGDAAKRPRVRPWRWLVWAAYPAVLAVPTWATLGFSRIIAVTGREVELGINLGLTVAFVVAAVFSVVLSRRFGQERATPRQRLGDRAMTTMFVIMVVLFVLMPTLALTADVSLGAAVGRSIEIVTRSLPLAFLFVGAYFESRFEFFDVLVKRGLTLLVTIAALALFFAAALPALSRFEGRETTPWVYAVALLPLAILLPWVHGRVSAALDRWWLGRRFTVVDAVKHFIATIRSATTEAELVALAEQALGDIFGAPALVRAGNAQRLPGFVVQQQIPIRSGAAGNGAILMGPRASEAPYFSGDVSLLASLADVFAAALDNLHLQARKQEQEQRAHELSLHASRAELKALRAQINPHFLFNALNAISVLIRRNPGRADRTIEQLADVFRYALRGSESEWAVLADEVEFVRAYLEVERARFGERLDVEIDVADDVRGARIPTMVVQTLVENAVKHGLSEVTGTAFVGIRAMREGERVIVTVADNGEGFNATALQRTEAQRRGGGYGLANIRQRLSGYFGADAELRIGRDADRGLTVVSVVVPLVRQPVNA